MLIRALTCIPAILRYWLVFLRETFFREGTTGNWFLLREVSDSWNCKPNRLLWPTIWPATKQETIENSLGNVANFSISSQISIYKYRILILLCDINDTIKLILIACTDIKRSCYIYIFIYIIFFNKEQEIEFIFNNNNDYYIKVIVYLDWNLNYLDLVNAMLILYRKSYISFLKIKLIY